MKLKSFCTAEETIDRMKRQYTEWKNVFTNDITNKGLVSNVFPVVYVDVRIGPQIRLSAKELMLSNCGAGEDS